MYLVLRGRSSFGFIILKINPGNVLSFELSDLYSSYCLLQDLEFENISVSEGVLEPGILDLEDIQLLCVYMLKLASFGHGVNKQDTLG